jgi:hypothetical protein
MRSSFLLNSSLGWMIHYDDSWFHMYMNPETSHVIFTHFLFRIWSFVEKFPIRSNLERTNPDFLQCENSQRTYVIPPRWSRILGASDTRGVIKVVGEDKSPLTDCSMSSIELGPSTPPPPPHFEEYNSLGPTILWLRKMGPRLLSNHTCSFLLLTGKECSQLDREWSSA